MIPKQIPFTVYYLNDQANKIVPVVISGLYTRNSRGTTVDRERPM
jgi:hypothetical protein